MMVWARAVTVSAFQKCVCLKTKSSFISDQSMFNTSEWIAAEWWNCLQTNTKHICAHSLHTQHIMWVEIQQSWECKGRSACQRPAIISVMHLCCEPFKQMQQSQFSLNNPFIRVSVWMNLAIIDISWFDSTTLCSRYIITPVAPDN